MALLAAMAQKEARREVMRLLHYTGTGYPFDGFGCFPGPFEIIDDPAMNCTPIELQRTHVVAITAFKLSAEYPEFFRIEEKP